MDLVALAFENPGKDLFAVFIVARRVEIVELPIWIARSRTSGTGT